MRRFDVLEEGRHPATHRSTRMGVAERALILIKPVAFCVVGKALISIKVSWFSEYLTLFILNIVVFRIFPGYLDVKAGECHL